MAKKKAVKPRREVTRRQLSRLQKQKRRQRLIFISGILVIVAVVSIVGVGWYVGQYRPLHEIVIRVNETEHNMSYYIKMLKYYSGEQPASLTYNLAAQAITMIQQNELMRQGAENLGITISREAVDEELKSRDPPLSTDYRDAVRAELLAVELRDEYFGQEVPVIAEQRHIMAMFLESERQALEVSARLEAGESFAELAGSLSLEPYSQREEGDLGWQPRGILPGLLATSVPEEHAFAADVGVLSQPVYDEDIIKRIGYWIIKVLDRSAEPEQAHVQVILLGSEEEAQAVKGRLEAGEDFATLAQELSQHQASKDNNGELTGLTPGTMSAAFDEFTFNPELEPGGLSEISEPIRDDTAVTKGGYWLIKVVEVDENRQIEDEDREVLKTNAFIDWFSYLMADPGNRMESYLNDIKILWAMDKASGG